MTATPTTSPQLPHERSTDVPCLTLVTTVRVVVDNLGAGSGREWLVAGAGAAALVLALVANVMNAEGFVARHNLQRAGEGAALDVDYLATLSDDAVPAIADVIATEVDPARRDALRVALRCGQDADGVATLNVAARRAAELRAAHCG